MNKLTLTLFLMMTAFTAFAQDNEAISSKIIALEKSALEQWNNGNPDGYLEIYAEDIVYFDPFVERRLDGLDTLTALYESIRGKVHTNKHEMLNPLVQHVKDMAVLTFNFIAYTDNACQKWNCTEVFRKEADGTWKIIQSHWSLTKPDLNIRFED